MFWTVLRPLLTVSSLLGALAFGGISVAQASEGLVSGADVVAWQGALSIEVPTDRQAALLQFLLDHPDSPLAISAYDLLVAADADPANQPGADRAVVARVRRAWQRMQRNLAAQADQDLPPLQYLDSRPSTPDEAADDGIVAGRRGRLGAGT